VAGIAPVFCDVDPVTHNIDRARRGARHARTTGILGVHVWGGRATSTRSGRSPIVAV